MTLSNLGNLYNDTQQFEKVENAFLEALQMRKILAQKNPEIHTPDVAMTLSKLGDLYSNIQQFEKAEKFFTEALQIKRTLAEKNPDVFNYSVAVTLDNLGSLYKNMKNIDSAKKAFTEAIQKYEEAALWFDAARSMYNLFTVTLDEKTLIKSIKLLEIAILLSKEEKYK